jgi:hypothetical protein
MCVCARARACARACVYTYIGIYKHLVRGEGRARVDDQHVDEQAQHRQVVLLGVAAPCGSAPRPAPPRPAPRAQPPLVYSGYTDAWRTVRPSARACVRVPCFYHTLEDPTIRTYHGNRQTVPLVHASVVPTSTLSTPVVPTGTLSTPVVPTGTLSTRLRRNGPLLLDRCIRALAGGGRRALLGFGRMRQEEGADAVGQHVPQPLEMQLIAALACVLHRRQQRAHDGVDGDHRFLPVPAIYVYICVCV